MKKKFVMESSIAVKMKMSYNVRERYIKTLKCPQDWDEMTFRSKIFLNEIKNEFEWWKTKRRY